MSVHTDPSVRLSVYDLSAFCLSPCIHMCIYSSMARSSATTRGAYLSTRQVYIYIYVRLYLVLYMKRDRWMDTAICRLSSCFFSPPWLGLQCLGMHGSVHLCFFLHLLACMQVARNSSLVSSPPIHICCLSPVSFEKMTSASWIYHSCGGLEHYFYLASHQDPFLFCCCCCSVLSLRRHQQLHRMHS